MEREIRQQRQDMIYAQKERIRSFFDGVAIVVALTFIIGLMIGVVSLISSAS